jgi:ATP-dependent Clp protease ATP-binding subunit ClpB
MEDVMKGDVKDAAKSLAKLSNAIQDALHNTFRPEFLNRIDDVITFHALSIANMEPIVELQLADVRKRLEDRRVTLDVTDGAMEHLAIDGFDPVYGARPCKRLVQREVVDGIAQKIVEGKLPDKSHVLLDIDEQAGKYEIRVEPPLNLE